MYPDKIVDPKKLLCSWSGGKDSCFALMKTKTAGNIPTVLLNVLNEEGKISRSHGIPVGILKAQAAAIGILIQTISSSWNNYETNFVGELKQLKGKYEVSAAVFGDIDLLAHREWEEKVCATAGLGCMLPLWQQNRQDLVISMLQNNIECIIVSCNEILGEEFLGKKLTVELIAALAEKGVDVCGENGEFHTLVTSCPLFAYPIKVEVKAKLHYGNYWFTDLQLA